MLNNNTYKIPMFDFSPSRHKKMRIFTYEKYRKARDVLALAYSIFNLEKRMQVNNIENVQIERFLDKNKEELKYLFSELSSYVFLEDIDFSFVKSKIKLRTKKIGGKINKSDTIVLFSGGVDSFSGIFWAKETFNSIQGLFCAHSDQAWSINIANKISEATLAPSNIPLISVNVPAIGKGRYSQLRGFLYILVAGAWMNILGANTLVISECGPTMYQPRFGPHDSVTMTTHPFVVDIALSVLRILLGPKINFVTPFENMTKAEVIAVSKSPEYLSNTHSCVSQRFGDHDGTCYGCVIRRLGAIVADVKDVEYRNNPMTDSSANKDNLLSLLMFSRDILTDYKEMPLYQIENIESFNKKNLFQRFALDNFAAIYLLKEEGFKMVKGVETIYDDCIAEIGEKQIVDRIEAVRNKDFTIKDKPI